MDDTSFIRLGVFAGVFVTMAALEAWLPARRAALRKRTRWQGNLAMVVLGALAARVVLPATLAGVAMWAGDQSVGLFNQISVHPFVAVALSMLLLDVAIYWQHRLFHAVPLLWRLHKVHHADSHTDTTTGLRFHPLEIVLSLFVKAAVIILLGAPVMAVLIFEIALNAFSIFNHANIRLPQRWDDRLALVLITQRLHRIHHSQHSRETNRNFGFSVTWWDRLFGSYTPRAAQSDEMLDIGLKEYPPSSSSAGILALLSMPFKPGKTKSD
ncbi:sterol desaturase family protein [Alteromonas halophila]|uniref:Fatty acid hydroxylase n=1 Tax=Alteromonas halophila TaxID=516698 RepID=A0A918MVW4_9ALTE|nr:sterol desaturase family protein [Alteromonas halophila]GGW77792.1 fatty acid hydroxylase [Alteromonas halophila]